MNGSYSDRLAKAELYLSRAESRLDAEVQGTRLHHQLWLVTECLSAIDGDVGLEVAKLDVAGQDLGELENITIALTRLAQRRRLLFIRVAEKYGLDAHLLIAGDSIEMDRLEYSLSKAESPPDDERQREQQDGPLPGNRFCWDGKVYQTTTVLWKLLESTWGDDYIDSLDVEESVWGDALAGETTLKSNVRDLNAFLKKSGYPKRLSKVRGQNLLVWKVRQECETSH